jgi:hypothetical protein
VQADPDEISIEQFAAGLRDAFIACRELGHVWRPHTVAYDQVSKSYDRVLRCTRCRTERVQVLNRHGHVVANRYRYVEGYQAKHVERGVYTRDVFRVEAVERFLRKASERA